MIGVGLIYTLKQEMYKSMVVHLNVSKFLREENPEKNDYDCTTSCIFLTDVFVGKITQEPNYFDDYQVIDLLTNGIL